MISTKTRYPRTFLYFSAAFAVSGFIVTFLTEKGSVVLALNKIHDPVLNTFFRIYTFLGSGWILLITALVVLFASYRLLIAVIIMSAFQGLVSLFFKVILFPQVKRPTAYFEHLDLQLVEGVDLLYFRSFPSGHTMTAFGIAAFFAMFSTKWWVHLLLFFFVFLIAISRIYLSLHFLIDTVAGSIIGSAITIITMRFIRTSTHLNHHLLDGRLSI